jgi:UDP-N-acetylglucosamine 2-epimerase (non-hydrolysing)
MLDQVLEIFQIKPDIDLNLMSNAQDLTDICSSVLVSMRDVFTGHKPDLVLVHGDTTTTMAAAMAAFYAGVPVGHIEAGLRTFDLSAPFPEEFNRQVVGKLASFHFAPTDESKENLVGEGVPIESIWVTGNTVIDALHMAQAKLRSNPRLEFSIGEDLFKELNFSIAGEKYVLITGHRRENFGEGFTNICNAIKELSIMHPEIHFVYPVHLNPNVQAPVNSILGNIPNVHLIEPQDYLHFLLLLENCYLVLTDSGGIQEEAPSLNKPVLVMRETTERPEAVKTGAVELVGTARKSIVDAVNSLLENEERYLRMASAPNPYGDGTASSQITSVLKKNL